MVFLGKRVSLAAALGVWLVVVLGSAALAALLISQQANAELSMASSGDFNLYICEPGDQINSDGWIAGPGCGSDDSDRNEIIFQKDEDAAPGSLRYWDIRLVNEGNAVAWDLWSFDIAINPSNPEAEACGAPPAFTSSTVRILGKVDSAGGYTDPDSGLTYDSVNDNERYGSGPSPVADSIALSTMGGGSRVVHVEPGDYEDLQLGAWFRDQGQGSECLGAIWTLDVTWNVAAHS